MLNPRSAQDQYTAGKIVHSGKFTSGKDWQGKKVVVVGACTSAHDICKVSRTRPVRG